MIIQSECLVVDPLVSVLIITYNQEKTISQTIDSILMQEGGFHLELVIGEDCGTDNTRKICIEYQRKYSEKITLLLQEGNQGLVKNFVDTLKLCRGKFIAICAGDDYWIDNYKLSKQIRFFDLNPDYGVVSTSGYRFLVKKNKFIQGIAPFQPELSGEVFHLTHIGGVYAMPLSLLIKKKYIDLINFDEFIRRKFSCEDVPMQAILAKHTKFGHIHDLCVVYRVYNTSQTYVNFNHPRYIHYHQGLVEIRRYLNELFPDEVQFSEQWAHDYMVYRRFLIAVYNLNFVVARKELLTLHELTVQQRKTLQRTKTRIGFLIFSLAKRLKLMKSEMI